MCKGNVNVFNKYVLLRNMPFSIRFVSQNRGFLFKRNTLERFRFKILSFTINPLRVALFTVYFSNTVNFSTQIFFSTEIFPFGQLCPPQIFCLYCSMIAYRG